ncbi:extracellular solute-binding protein [Microbacterium sp. RD1]|uniref:extracellular solute-binding protein n=1 Tax=Microbacterium sp. RD1 TaxID=3457313 RepID=UPI003FA5D1FF
MTKTKMSLAVLAALATTVALSACAGGGASAPEESGDGDQAASVTLTYVGYGGDGQAAQIEAWQKPYTAANPNVTFINTSPPDVAQVKAQVESGAIQWDVMAIAPYAAEQNCDTLFEPLEFDDLDETDLVEGAVGECYIGNWINTTPFAYRTDAFPEGKGPKTIEDFFDLEKFPGQRGIVTNLQNGILEYPLLADGVAPDELYPLDVDRALDKLDEIRDNTLFAPNVGALQQAVASNQVDMFFLPDSRLVPLMKDGTDITIVWDGAVASINGFAVPKGSTKLEAAEAFMASVTAPEQVAKITELLGVAPINLASEPKLDEYTEKLDVFNPEVNPGETVIQDIDWYAENFNEVTTQVTNWLAG